MDATKLYSTVTGFLNHHVNDLSNIATTLEGIVAALPINAETRAALAASIARVNSSADEIVTSLNNMGAFTVPEIHIAESDIVKALGDGNTRAVLTRVVADYMAAHPELGTAKTPTAQVGESAATAAAKGANMDDALAAGKAQDDLPQEGVTGANAGNAPAPVATTGA